MSDIKEESNISEASNKDDVGSTESFIDEANQKINVVRTISICLVIATGGLIQGYDTGSISGIVNMPKYAEAVGDKISTDPVIYQIPSWRSGLIVAGVSFGGLFGSLLLGKLADKWGRRTGLIICTSLISIASVIQGAGHNVWGVVLFGRIVSGFCIGGLSAVCPMYLSETSPARLRSVLVSMFQLLMTVGILIGEIVSLCASYWTNNIGQYMLPLFLICFFAIMILIGCILILPESTRYLISKGDIQGAKNSLSRVMGLPSGSVIIAREIKDMQLSINSTRETGNASWKDICTFDDKIMYRIILGMSIMMLQQLTGINYFFYYGTSLFKEVSNINPFATSIILGAVNVIGTIFCIPVIARFPRRNVLMTGSIVMFISLILFACLGSFALNKNGIVSTKVGSGMIALACIFIVGFAGTWAPVSFLVISEMFPQKIRSKGISLAVASNWLLNTVITIVAPIATKAIGYKFGFVFCGFTFISIFVVYFFVYETRGHTLEDIEEMFVSGISARQSPRWKSRVPIAAERDIKIDRAHINNIDQGL